MDRKLSPAELLARQAEQSTAKRLPFSVILNNVRSLYNVGSIFRTADGIGVEKIWLCGITGTPPAPRLAKTALGAEKSVPWEYRPRALDAAQELKRQGYQVVLLEQTEHSVPYQQCRPRGPLCLVLGNEIHGVSDELVRSCDESIEIEMAGLKNSLNVTVAFGIAAYHIRNELLSVNVRAREFV